MLMSAGLPVSANAINKDVGVHTKVCLNVRHRVVRPSPHRRKNCVSRNQAQTLSHERVTRQPPTLDCGSTEYEMNYYRSQEGSLEMARLN